MRKHLQNLERVCQKLQYRYGDTDELVVQLKNELESLKATRSTQPAWANQSWNQQRPDQSAAPPY